MTSTQSTAFLYPGHDLLAEIFTTKTDPDSYASSICVGSLYDTFTEEPRVLEDAPKTYFWGHRSWYYRPALAARARHSDRAGSSFSLSLNKAPNVEFRPTRPTLITKARFHLHIKATTNDTRWPRLLVNVTEIKHLLFCRRGTRVH